jgi:hypothetical protein
MYYTYISAIEAQIILSLSLVKLVGLSQIYYDAKNNYYIFYWIYIEEWEDSSIQ